MFHAACCAMIAVAAVLGGLLIAGRDHRHGREVVVMTAVCVVCNIVGLAGVLG